MGARRFRALLRGMPHDAAWIRVADEAAAQQPPPPGGGRVVHMRDWTAQREPDVSKATATLRRMGLKVRGE